MDKVKLHEIKYVDYGVWAVVTTTHHPVGGGLEVAYKTTRDYAEQFIEKLEHNIKGKTFYGIEND